MAGIDYSTHAVDVVLIDENDELAPQWHRYPLKGVDAFDRTRHIREAFTGTESAWRWHTLAVGIEDPRGQNAGALYRIMGGILQVIPSDILVQPWIPSQWRKAVGLPGNCTKEAVKEWVDSWVLIMERPGAGTTTLVDGFPQDVCDAYCIALATRQAITREQGDVV